MVPTIHLRISWESLLQNRSLSCLSHGWSQFTCENGKLRFKYQLFTFMSELERLHISAAKILRLKVFVLEHCTSLQQNPSCKGWFFVTSCWKFCLTLFRTFLSLRAENCPGSEATWGYSTKNTRMVYLSGCSRSPLISVSQSHTVGIVKVAENYSQTFLHVTFPVFHSSEIQTANFEGATNTACGR